MPRSASAVHEHGVRRTDDERRIGGAGVRGADPYVGTWQCTVNLTNDRSRRTAQCQHVAGAAHD